MSRRTLRWTKRALRRLDQIGARISEDSPAAAARVVARLVAAADALAEHPAMGRPGRLEGTRELVLADVPYILPYRVGPEYVDILTVMHATQKWSEEL